jgi:hypothetical protein
MFVCRSQKPGFSDTGLPLIGSLMLDLHNDIKDLKLFFVPKKTVFKPADNSPYRSIAYTITERAIIDGKRPLSLSH